MYAVGLCEFHRHRAQTMTAERCSTALTVPWPYGAAFEFTATLVNYVIWSTTFADPQRNGQLELYAKSLFTSVVAVASKWRRVGIAGGVEPPSSCLQSLIFE